MLQAPAAKTTLEVATFPSGVSTPTTFIWGRLSFCQLVIGLSLDVAIYSAIHLVQCSCFLPQIVPCRPQQEFSSQDSPPTPGHLQAQLLCIEEAFRRLTTDQLSNWLSKTSPKVKNIHSAFYLFCPNFSAEKKNVVVPTRISCTARISWNIISDWLPIVFHFGTENWEEQLKKASCRFLLTPGICCGETSGVNRAICGAVDPAQEVRDVQMGQQL